MADTTDESETQRKAQEPKTCDNDCRYVYIARDIALYLYVWLANPARWRCIQFTLEHVNAASNQDESHMISFSNLFHADGVI